MFILANHGGFIQRYRDTGDTDAVFGNSLRKHPPIIMKNSIEVARSPILSPKNFLGNADGSKEFISPKKNFETNQLENGLNQWFPKTGNE